MSNFSCFFFFSGGLGKLRQVKGGAGCGGTNVWSKVRAIPLKLCPKAKGLFSVALPCSLPDVRVACPYVHASS